jgi:hypothetical protein
MLDYACLEKVIVHHFQEVARRAEPAGAAMTSTLTASASAMTIAVVAHIGCRAGYDALH